jgi:hypothetical protein
VTALATHAYLIKGYLLAKEAPKAIIDSIEAIIEELGRGEVTITGDFTLQGMPAPDLAPPFAPPDAVTAPRRRGRPKRVAESSPGEAHASPSSGASGAARPKW